MPYIEIKAYPKDEEIKKDVANDILEVFAKKWGCKKEAITISFTEVDPANWNTDVEENIINKNNDKMYVLHGNKVK